MTDFKVAICSKSRTEECAREAAVRKAAAALTNPSALSALRLFEASLSQWRASMGGIVGLDYPAVFQVASVLGIGVDAELFAYLRVLEADQLEAWKPGNSEEQST
jgi:hypothetical protein